MTDPSGDGRPGPAQPDGHGPSEADAGDGADLRELLIASERRRQIAESSLRQAEAVLAGLEIVATAADEGQLFSGILDVVGELVPFDDAAVIVDGGDEIGYVAATDDQAPLGLLQPGPFLRRVFGGKPSIVMSLSMLPEWQPLADAGLAHRSGLFVPLRSKDRQAAFVCLAHGAAAYTTRHLEILQYLAPLAGQALQRYHDMNELGSLIDRLERLAHHDSLTGLSNRAVFSAGLARAVAGYETDGVPVAVLHLDLDDFKVVNDSMGHGAGDRLIEVVARRIETATRAADVVARLGGDEFAVLLTGVANVETVQRVANRILEEVNRPVDIHGQRLHPHASIGISACPQNDPDPASLLGSADIALYDAKAAGGGRVVTFSPDMRSARDQSREVEAELGEAISGGQLVLFYQPIVALGPDGPEPEPMAYEALVRWQHPVKGLLPPGHFLPVAERSQLIVEVDEWVLYRALDELGPWLKGDPARRVAVNVSAKQLLIPGHAATVIGILERYGLAPGALELELSEEIVARRTLETMLDNVVVLRDRGIGLSFDDFGTGYSSVLQLRKFPGHRLKIDRHFVSTMCVDRADLAVVKGMIDLARGLGLGVVAEGVEDQEQLDTLVELGCQEVQGYFLGRPQPARELGLGELVRH